MEDLAARLGVHGVSPRVLSGVVLLALLAIAWWAVRRANVAPSAEETFTTVAEENAAADSAEPTGSVVVHVCGAVCRAGVYELPMGARVSDAVDAAGGFLGNAAPDALNLARVLADGEQVIVPTQDEVANGQFASGAQGSSEAAGLVNINTASASELEALPGIGPATAARIVEDRETNGPFAAVEDLQRVSGIGPAKYDAVKDLVTVG